MKKKTKPFFFEKNCEKKKAQNPWKKKTNPRQTPLKKEKNFFSFKKTEPLQKKNLLKKKNKKKNTFEKQTRKKPSKKNFGKKNL